MYCKLMPVYICGCVYVCLYMHSGDESSEFEDEFDADFFKGEDDRIWMMSLTGNLCVCGQGYILQIHVYISCVFYILNICSLSI